jgi:hypothetical protein
MQEPITHFGRLRLQLFVETTEFRLLLRAERLEKGIVPQQASVPFGIGFFPRLDLSSPLRPFGGFIGPARRQGDEYGEEQTDSTSHA